MKKQLVILLLFSTIICSYAQNVEMAKAFYKKALQAYEDENYQEALSLIEKTKENLNGKTNPDIIYIEAKSRFENDLNINEAKKLFNQFLNEADTDDNRRSEASDILVDLETSDKYYNTGYIKSKKIKEKDGNYNIIYYRKDGIIYRVNTFFNNILLSVTNYNNRGKRVQYYKIYYNKGEKVVKSILQNNYVTEIISYQESSSIDNQNTYFRKEANYIVPNNEYTYQDYIQVLEYYENEKNGVIKKILIPESKRGWRRQNQYTFDINGVPIKKVIYVRGKIESSYIFNKETTEWIKE